MNATAGRRLGPLCALIAAMTLLLTGCMRMDMDVRLRGDDTVDGSIVMAVSDQVADVFGTDPEALWEEMSSDLGNDLPSGATYAPYAQDGYTGTRATFADVPITEMSGTPDESGSLTIVREGDDFIVSGVIDLSGAESGAFFADEFDVRIAVTFPGAVSEHNGTLRGRTVVWEPSVGERLELIARGAATGGVLGVVGGASWWWLAVPVSLLGFAGLVLLVLLIVRARSRMQPAAGAEAHLGPLHQPPPLHEPPSAGTRGGESARQAAESRDGSPVAPPPPPEEPLDPPSRSA